MEMIECSKKFFQEAQNDRIIPKIHEVHELLEHDKCTGYDYGGKIYTMADGRFRTVACNIQFSPVFETMAEANDYRNRDFINNGSSDPTRMKVAEVLRDQGFGA